MIYELDSGQLRMSWADPAPARAVVPEVPSETFCTYLAKQFVTKKGFQVASIPEVQRLAGTCDFVLTRKDGLTFTILCMVDREAYPDEIFHLDVDEVRQIGDACLKYTRKLGPAQPPVFVRILEIGPGATVHQQQRLKQYKRASSTSRVVPSAMIVDPAVGKAWNSEQGRFTKGAYQGFVEKMLTAPRQAGADLITPAIAVATPSFPFVTAAILAMLLAVFAAEIVFGIGTQAKPLQPTVGTLLAFGGLTGIGVLQYGEWYRLLSAPFVHLDALHLAMNAMALSIAGWRLERLVGRAWFGAVYAVGALGGSLLALALNPPSFIAVGASGAIMGLLAAIVIAAAHFPPGAIRTGLLVSAVLALIPSLVPLASSLPDHVADYATHAGGAIGGALVSFVMLRVWSRDDARPGFRRVAAAVAIAGAVALIYPAVAVPRIYQAMAFLTQLIPADQVPKTSTDMRARAPELIAQYPRDPRPRFLRAADMLDANDLAGAEREARIGLADEGLWRPVLAPQLGNGLRIMLAVAISGDRPDEARSTASPACAAVKDGPMRKLLDDRKLCGS